jgi:hypothetical protein
MLDGAIRWRKLPNITATSRQSHRGHRNRCDSRAKGKSQPRVGELLRIIAVSATSVARRSA